MTSRSFEIRARTDLPFYCKPTWLFLAVWSIMLVTFQLQISYTSSPDIVLALTLFTISLISFFLGSATVRSAYLAVDFVAEGPTRYRIDITKLRRFHYACLAVTLCILFLNWKLYGEPPLFGFFGADTLLYGEYGSLKQVLFPAFMAVSLTAPLEPSWMRRWSLYAFGPFCALIYASRGYLLILLFQMLLVFSLRTSLSKRKIYLVALSTLGVAITISNVIGNGRMTDGTYALLHYMQIKRAYYDWPTAYLWMISYISSPLSNLCWIIHVYPYHAPSMSFLFSLVPGFAHLHNLEGGDLGSDSIVDGVHTYIAKYYLDFWWMGVFAINYAWGLVAGYIDSGNRLQRQFLVSSVLLSCLGFIFFADFLTFLIIVIELATLSMAHRYFSKKHDAVRT